MVHTEEHESQIKCPADKFYRMYSQDVLDLPNAMPGSYKSIQVLEGDGTSLGTVRLWTYAIPNDPTKHLTVKEQLEEIDDVNRRLTLRILEGEVMEDYESLAVKLSVTPTSDGGSLVKWVVEFEKKHDHSPHPHTHVDMLKAVNSHFDALFHKADEVMSK